MRPDCQNCVPLFPLFVIIFFLFTILVCTYYCIIYCLRMYCIVYCLRMYCLPLTGTNVVRHTTNYFISFMMSHSFLAEGDKLKYNNWYCILIARYSILVSIRGFSKLDVTSIDMWECASVIILHKIVYYYYYT
jgi:hypothetical protein